MRRALSILLAPHPPTGADKVAGHPAELVAGGASPPPVSPLSEVQANGAAHALYGELSAPVRPARAGDFEVLAQERGEVLQLLMTHAPIGIFQTDPTGHLIRTNARWREIARLAHVQEPRGVWWQMVHPADRERVVAQWQGALRHGYEFRIEFRLNSGGGPECHARTRIMPAFGPEGVVRSCIGVSEDITERRRLEAELHRAQDDLEARIKVRTRQLETANRELAQFAHLVAHDLKAPLRAVSHLADWVARDYAGQVDVKGHELLGLLRQRVRYMHDLIEGVLAFTRLGEGAEPDVEVAVGELVGRVLASLAPPPHILVHLPPDLPQVRGVPERLQQVFQNLFDNAIKFMDKPEGVITLRAIRLRDAWQFAVADNGPGIEPRYHGRVFGVFQRLHPESRPGSTGIGLALVKKIVETRGGEISLDSAVGQGATFTFTWPDKPVRLPADLV